MKYGCAMLSMALMCATFASAVAQDRDFENFLLNRHEAGDLKIGMAIDSVYPIYGDANIQLVDLRLEGQFSPAIRIFMDGGPDSAASLEAEIGCGKQYSWFIYRINVYDTRFITKEGIGIGSTLGDVRKVYKVNWIDYGEGPLMAGVEDLEMTFELDLPIENLPATWFELEDPGLIPDSVAVRSIVLYEFGR
jgi:hypothetical protein